jgi:hypothetical protein
MDIDIPFTVAIAVVVPLVLGAAVGYPFWRQRKVIFGNIVSSIAVGLVIIGLIVSGFGAFFACSTAADGAGCGGYTLDDATRLMIGLAVIGWVDVFLLLVLSGFVEDRARKRNVRMEDL